MPGVGGKHSGTTRTKQITDGGSQHAGQQSGRPLVMGSEPFCKCITSKVRKETFGGEKPTLHKGSRVTTSAKGTWTWWLQTKEQEKRYKGLRKLQKPKCLRRGWRETKKDISKWGEGRRGVGRTRPPPPSSIRAGQLPFPHKPTLVLRVDAGFGGAHTSLEKISRFVWLRA